MTRRNIETRALFARRSAGLLATAFGAVLLLVGGCGGGNSAGAPDAGTAVADAGTPDAGSPDFTVAGSTSQLALRVAEVTPLEVIVHRRGGFAAPVDVTVTGLPAGVSANPITIPAGATQGTVMLDAANGHGGDQATATVVGTSGNLLHTAFVGVLVAGTAGSRDTGFGTGGVADVPPGAIGTKLASVLPLPDGRFIATGVQGSDLVAIRFNGDGTADTSFGQGGVARASFSAAGLGTLAGGYGGMQSDGAVVVAGSGKGKIAVARFTATGARDSAFASQNGGVYGPGGFAVVTGLVMDSMDRAVVSGTIFTNTRNVTLLARLDTTGALDASFDSTGVATGDPAVATGSPIIDDSGRIVFYSRAGSNPASTLVRYSSAGVRDASFNPSAGAIGAIAPLPGGDILVCTQTGTLERIGSDGSVDAGFGTSSVVTISGATALRALIVTPSGRAITSGMDTASQKLLLARVGDLSTGALDPSFGSGGIARDSMPGGGIAVALRTSYELLVISGPGALGEFWY